MKAMKLTPAFKDYLWGGTKLRDEFGKKCDFDKVAESWELSCHKDGNSVVASGEYAGMTLAEYVEKAGKGVLGTDCEKFENFPILIKLIDAKDNLSVQVHPDNEYALRVEGEYGKTEMWYVVDCEPGASLLYGFTHEISKEEFKERIENNTLLEVTNRVEVHPGDMFFIDAKTLHAIGSGILIAEIQQNSNTTYRVYDYGRVGADGKTRPLHIEKAMDVTSLTPPCRPVGPQGKKEILDGYTSTLLASCEYFTVHEMEIAEKAALCADEKSFHSLLVLDGSLTLCMDGEDLALVKGDSVFIPANAGNYTLSGKAKLVHTIV
ncbi:MAG: type I phosphomannose isomerase catalytic subunit [Candidatus Merdivicinus sp.]|jgi:mannose-6-phosphate isomerase